MVIEVSHANKYDKIFKENIEYTLPGIIKNILGLSIVNAEEISHNLQHTIERKPDVLKKVTDQNNRTYILHVELQAQNDKNMLYRMVEYRVMLQRKYRLPVKQYVMFVGGGRLTMISSIDEEDFKFRYNIVSPQQIDYKIFLQSGRPEEKILAILGDFGEDEPEKVVQDIVDGIENAADGDLGKDKYFHQLHVLIQLRNLDVNLVDMIDTAKYFRNIQKDPIYLKGIADGEAKGEKKTALEMKKRGFEVGLISDITKLPIEEIETL